MEYEKKLIEGNFPCQQVGAETRRERGASSALPPINFLHVWWARRPLTASRAAVLGSILPADTDTSKFLKELGIKKKQMKIDDIWIDIPEKLSEQIEDGKLMWSKEVGKALSDEMKLRKELRDICSKLKESDPSIVQNEDIQLLEERSKEITLPSKSNMLFFETKEVAADPAWFNRVMEICTQYQIRIPNLYGYGRAYQNNPHGKYSNYTVLDSTAGGGAIPFEALRLGCNVLSNDLNPVASAIQIATLKYPTLYGPELCKSLEQYGRQLLDKVSEKMKPYFWLGTDTEIVTSFLYCRYVTCPSCGERVPLLNAFALQKKNDGWMVIPKIEGQKGNRFIRLIPTRLINGKGRNGENPEDGTVNKGTGTCLCCGQAIESEEIKRQARGESPHGAWSDELYCVVGVREQPKLDKNGNIQYYSSGVDKGKIKTEKVTFFREPVDEDYKAIERAKAALDENWEHWDKMGLIPTERIPEGHKTHELHNVGIHRWCDMFTPRQLLGILTAEETLLDLSREIISEQGQERGTAIIHYLQYMIDKCIDYNSRQTRWHYSRGVMVGSFGRHDYSLKWSFGELILTGPSSGLAWGVSQILDAYKDVCKLIGNNINTNVQVLNGSASCLSLEDRSVDGIIVDPPYYNNVQYAELSDYFYVWQKRIFKDLYPDIFSRRLTNKNDEAVANPVRDGSAKAANENYERLMSEIFAECRRVLKDDGIMTLMFTHKTQAAWETLTRALIENGWLISSTFPVESEPGVSMHQMDQAAAASSIFIACRKRPLEEREPAVWSGFGGKGVLPELRDAVSNSLREYESLRLNAVDEMVASYGSALKILSKNWPVMDGDELVTPIRAMKEAGTVVAQHQMMKMTDGRLSVDDVAPEAGVALTLFGIYGMSWFPFDDALSLSKSLNIRLENKAAGYRDEGRMIGINDEKRGTNKDINEETGYFAPVIKKGSKLRLVFPEERIKRRLDAPQNEWDILQGVIMAYREGDIPVARAYLQKHAEGHEDLIKGILQVWADGCGSEELKKEARRILYGLK